MNKADSAVHELTEISNQISRIILKAYVFYSQNITGKTWDTFESDTYEDSIWVYFCVKFETKKWSSYFQERNVENVNECSKFETQNDVSRVVGAINVLKVVRRKK